MDQDPKAKRDAEQQTEQNITPETTPQPSSEAPQATAPPPTTGVHAVSDVRLPEDKQQRHLRVIVGSVIGIFLLVLLGCVVWFFACYNRPEKAVLDSIDYLLSAKNLSLDGAVSLNWPDSATDAPLKSLTIELDSSNTSLPNATDVTLLAISEEGKNINLKLGTVQMTDGVLYLKISGIIDSLKNFGLETGTEDADELVTAFENIDDEWWRISVRDLLKENLSENAVQLYDDIVDCNAELGTRDYAAIFNDLYGKNKFIQVTPVKQFASSDGYVSYQPQAWHNLYEISLDRDALARFLNSVPETEVANQLVACYNTAIQDFDPSAKALNTDDITEISAEDIDLPDELRVYAEISQFGHKLRSAWSYIDGQDYGNAASLLFKYHNIEVSAPSEYRDITELFEELPVEDIWSAVTVSGGGMVDSDIDADSYYHDTRDYTYDPWDDTLTGSETEEI